ncbi:MAG TPA: response regulator transcription factor [Bacteroidia bacterium]|nr:response regulator transcription factor [Bacteroidia bacterium]
MTVNGKVRVYIIDDHQMLIDGIKALLSHSKKYEIIGEETNAIKAFDKIQQLKPDLVITDISMPNLNGIELTKIIRVNNPVVKICALSMHMEKDIIAQILRNGANGYVLKNTGKHELIEALDKIMDGQIFISNNISIDLLFGDNHANQAGLNQSYSKLSERELEILKLISQEMSNLQIANVLFISERTVESHRKNIFRKTNTKSAVGLIKFAIEHQLI